MSELKLTEADRGKSFEIHRNDIVVIRLQENPTTGYCWEVDKSDEKILPLQGSEFLLPKHPKFGEGGTRVFKFKAKKTGTAHIQLKHWREWEGDGSIDNRFDITSVVKG